MKGGATISLSVALALGVFACPQLARAQAGHNMSAASQSTNSAVNHSQAMHNPAQAKKVASQMVPATANLKEKLDARKLHPGDPVQAVLHNDVQLKNGPKLDDGTVLLGKVTADQTGQDHSRLALRFDRAKLSNGQTVPIKATVIQVASPHVMAGSGTDLSSDSILWNPNMLQVDQVGAVSGADLHSAIGSHDSVVLVSKKDDIKLDAGEQLALVIAARNDQRSGL